MHPFIYFKEEDNKDEHCSFVIILESLEHNIIAFYSFQKKLIQFLKSKFDELRKILYFLAGSAAQYKNIKNFINLLYHKKDLAIKAKWHFFLLQPTVKDLVME